MWILVLMEASSGAGNPELIQIYYAHTHIVHTRSEEARVNDARKSGRYPSKRLRRLQEDIFPKLAGPG
jgi:hypothetical protein